MDGEFNILTNLLTQKGTMGAPSPNTALDDGPTHVYWVSSAEAVSWPVYDSSVGELLFDKHKKYIASSPANLRRTSYLRTSSAPRLSILFNSPMIHSILLEQHIHFSTSTLLRRREMQHLYPTCSYWRAQRVRLPLLPFPTAFRKV